ncbi:MAG: glycosyltransferase family 4 protein [Lentisphaerae bacterium]|nr:glycosyltransferase family 4 protein [Lentisphaerota bacterium]
MPDPSRSIVDILNLSTDKCTAELKRRSDESGELELLAELGKTFGNAPTPAIIAKLVNFVTTCYPQAPRPIRTIGIYFNNFSLGGVQRVITSQFPIFQAMGIKTVLFTNTLNEENEYPLPEYIKRIQLPHLDAAKPDFRQNMEKWIELISAEKIDVFYSHDIYHIPRLYWNALLIKTIIKVPYFLHFHTVFSKRIIYGVLNDFVTQNELLKFSDLVISLSEVNNIYFNAAGIHSTCMPNQYFLPDREITPKDRANGKNILCLSRIDFISKCPLDTVKIMEYVIDKLPDAKLFIVGGGKSKDEDILKSHIANSRAANNIEFCGPTLDVAKFYQNADVFLATSSHEGFPVTLLESQAFGLPVVCYDMPYLDIIRRPDNGIITVPQEDHAAAADAIVKVLTDPELYRIKSRNGVKTAKYFAEYDLAGLWRQILADWQTSPQIQPSPESLTILLQTLNQHLYWCDKKQQQKLNSVQKNLKSTQNELKKIKSKNSSIRNSFSYRLGRALTWLPRKIRGGVRCLKQHGISYTIKRLKQKIHNLFSK